MIGTLKKYWRLTGLVWVHGRWRHSGENFNQNRKEGLKELQDFIPGRVIEMGGNAGSFLWKNSVTRNLIAQFAYIKSSYQTKGGHLSTHGLSYIRIPKSASTSMNKALLEKIYPALKQKTVTDKQINFLTDVNIQYEIGNGSNFFTIVRNPLSRLVSVYRDFFENTNHYIYRDYLFGVLPQGISFAEFVERIARIPDRLKDQHIRPQHTFLKYYEKKNLEVKIFKLEEGKELNQFLQPYAMQLPHLNKSTEPYDYRSYYDTNTLDNVCKIYQIDIERFGYQEEYKQVAEYVGS